MPLLRSIQRNYRSGISKILVGSPSAPPRMSLSAKFSSVRRRRRPAPSTLLGDRKKAAVSPEPIHETKYLFLSPEEFENKSKELLSELQTALNPLVPLNESMLLTRGNSKDDEIFDDVDNTTDGEGEDGSIPIEGEYLWIDLGPVHGQYQIQMDASQQMLVFMSPNSGQRRYKIYNGEWCCMEDGHNFKGLLVRDLIRQIQGVPQL